MIEIIRVIYTESTESQYTSKNFDMKERRAATNFAKSISKKSGRSSTVIKSKGNYFNGSFCEAESIHIATYADGKKSW
jgi:hypothetical protein